MSSLPINAAESIYGGNTGDEAAMLHKMAQANGYRWIYKYANDFGDRQTHTDFNGVKSDAQRTEFLNAPMAHNRVLVYDNGKPTMGGGTRLEAGTTLKV